MKISSFIFILLFLTSAFASEFRFHVNEEPAQLNPYKLDKISGRYVLTNMFQGYLSIDKDLELQSGLAEKCYWKTKVHAVCEMKKNHWSNGTEIKLEDYLESLKYHLKEQPQSFVSQALLPLAKENGLSIEAPNRIHFRLQKADADFFYRFAVPSFSPLPLKVTDSIMIGRDYATGPYKLSKWNRGRSLELVRNAYYPVKVSSAPLVRVYFIPEDNTALSMFEHGQLNLLRRLPMESEARFKDSKQMRYVHGLRFDYLGFADTLAKEKSVRRQLLESLDYQEFKKIFLSIIPPGCFGLPKQWSDFIKCYSYTGAKSTKENESVYKLYYSEGNENLTRSIQWFQNQWKKAGFNFRIEQEDYKALGFRLKENPPDAFRRGVPLDRPTCLSALETFESTSLDNFIRFKNKSYDEVVAELRENPFLSKSQRKQLCTKGLKILFESDRLLPLGDFRIPILVDSKFKGWYINGLNQLDLSHLEAVSK